MKKIRLNIKKAILLGMLVSTTNIQVTMAQEKITQTAGRVQLGEFAPSGIESARPEHDYNRYLGR